MNTENLDKLAEELYDWVNAHRADNLNKDGTPGDPRKISNPYQTMHTEVKTFYRNAVLWHLNKQTL
jgi:hypothetical protein